MSVYLRFLIFLLSIPGCIRTFDQTTEHVSSSTIKDGLAGNYFFSMSPMAGKNEVFVLNQISKRFSLLFFPPPDVHHAQLFIEMLSDLAKVGERLKLPSEEVSGYVCSEFHPWYWCGPTFGIIEILRETDDQIDLRLEAYAKPEKESPFSSYSDLRWDFEGELSFNKAKSEK